MGSVPIARLAFASWFTIVPRLGARARMAGVLVTFVAGVQRGVCTYVLRGAPPGCRFLVPDRPPFGGRGLGWWGLVIPQR